MAVTKQMGAMGFALAMALSAVGCGGAAPAIMPGRPEFHAGSPEGYWIWHDEGGWHLRTTTMANLHRFHGVIRPDGGQISELHPTRNEWNDRIHVGPNGIEFSFETQGNEDGFDWRVSSGCARFDLNIDGHVAGPATVHLGGNGNAPGEMPFARCR